MSNSTVAFVAGPKTPACAMPLLFWYFLSAFLVRAPKYPFATPFGMTRNPFDSRKVWRAETSSPRLKGSGTFDLPSPIADRCVESVLLYHHSSPIIRAVRIAPVHRTPDAFFLAWRHRSIYEAEIISRNFDRPFGENFLPRKTARKPPRQARKIPILYVLHQFRPQRISLDIPDHREEVLVAFDEK